MSPEIFIAQSDAEIEACFPVFQDLRPHVTKEAFLPQVRRQQTQGFRIVALTHDGAVKSAAGFRVAEYLAWGKVLYIDDLVTLPQERSNGFAGALLDWLLPTRKSIDAMRCTWTPVTRVMRRTVCICARGCNSTLTTWR